MKTTNRLRHKKKILQGPLDGSDDIVFETCGLATD
jgi:hypothetical protein